MTQASAVRPGLEGLRERAAARLAELGLPTVRIEEWRFTSPAPITRAAWSLEEAAPVAVAPSGLPALGDWGRTDVPLVAGRFAGPALAAGAARISSLTAATDPALGTIAPFLAPAHGFVAHNAAHAPGGVFIHVPAGEAVADPVRIAHLPGGGDVAGRTLVAPRVLVVVEAGASLTLIEDFRALAATPGERFTNAVTELALGEGARVTLVRLVGELENGFHVGAAFARLGAGARLETATFATGGPLVRDDVSVVFAGEGGSASLDGLFVVDGTQHVDHHTTLDHAVPHCESRELYKGVLGGAGRGVFNGAVVIRPDAQKSDSAQQNPNLLLSLDATIHTKPELQIHADDVKCAHGATVGQLAEDALFYLRARGIAEADARALLVHAFAREVVERIEHAGLRADVDAWIEARMARLVERGAGS
jgi:Fe-S cluster assembly protein SufD